MTLTDEPGSTDGKIAPAGGCPGNFFMSRKWSYDHDALTIRDFKGQALAELSFAGGHFEGQVPERRRTDIGQTLIVFFGVIDWKISCPNISSTVSPNPATPTARR